MVDASQLLVGGVGILVLTACTPHDLPNPEASGGLEDQAGAIDTMLAPALVHADEGRAREALKELMLAADVADDADLGAGLRCDFASGTVDLAEEFAYLGAYAESRMAYAVALNFADGCATDVRGEIVARREDARAAQQWAEQPSTERSAG